MSGETFKLANHLLKMSGGNRLSKTIKLDASTRIVSEQTQDQIKTEEYWVSV